MTYEAWRCTYQSSEQAARAAYERVQELQRQNAALKLEAQNAKQMVDAVGAGGVERLRKCSGLHQIQEPCQLAAAQQGVQPQITEASIRAVALKLVGVDPDAARVVADAAIKPYLEQARELLEVALATHPTTQGLKEVGYAANINGRGLIRFEDGWLPPEDAYDEGTLVKLFALPVSEEEAQALRKADAAQAKQGEQA